MSLALGRLEAQSTSLNPQRYDQGNPTDDEQYLMVKLNRARMDPVGEGQRLAAWLRTTPEGQQVVHQYGTDPDQVASDMAAFPAVPPLAFDPDLLAAARGHSTDMAATGVGGHTGSDGSTPFSRVQASGYQGNDHGENSALNMNSLDELHASYFVDWGVPDFGHRKNSMDGSSTNVVGIGLANVGGDNAVLAETEDYGIPPYAPYTVNDKIVTKDVPALLTGVVYSDANGNGQYDPGEGIAGVTVSMDGGKNYAVTSTSGGYALPLVNSDGSNVDGVAPVRMTFADGGTHATSVSVGHLVRTAPTSSGTRHLRTTNSRPTPASRTSGAARP